jgi:hypothetical protein
MTQPAYVDRAIKVLTGSGVRTDELQGRGEDFILSLLNSARGEVINLLSVNGRAAQVFYQEMYFAETDFVQESDCVFKIPCPKPLYDIQGFPYIGWVGGSDWNCADSFRIATSRSELRAANKHYIVGRSELTRAFYDTNMNCWWIYRNQSVNDFAVSQVNAEPHKSPFFNVETDDYPFPTDQDDRLMDLVVKRYFRELQGPVDAVPNSRNDTQIAQRR